MRTLIFTLALAAAPALAQHSGHGQHAPYAGMQDRAIKALSKDQIADLRAGKGMSLALAAELNAYPGPLHTLEHAAALGLTEAQKQETQALYARMKEEAIAQGEEVIRSEAALDRLFQDGKADAASVQAATAEAALAQGKLRAVHLRYHLRMRELLTPEQTQKYAMLRGYR